MIAGNHTAIKRRRRTLSQHLYRLLLLLFLWPSACSESAPSDSNATPVDTTTITPPGGDSLYHTARQTGILEDRRIVEASGIAASRKRDDVLWLHNDSGDEARLFAVDTAGRLLAEVRIQNATHVDWEDMASARINGVARLYIGDVGDNRGSRTHITVYRIDEPIISPDWRDTVLSVQAERMALQYPDGPRDCEALFVDPRNEMIYLISKTGDEVSGVYSLPWQTSDAPLLLERVGDLRIPAVFSPLRLITAADLSADASRLIIRTYFALFEYRGAADPLALLALPPYSIPSLPGQPQAEAACYSRDGRAIWLASEGLRQPVYYLRRK
jgi:hypothetical protein